MCLCGLLEQVPVWLVPGEDVQRSVWLTLSRFPGGRARQVRNELAAAGRRAGPGAGVEEDGKLPR